MHDIGCKVWGVHKCTSLVPRPHLACSYIASSIMRGILKAICTGVGFGSGTKTISVHTLLRCTLMVTALASLVPGTGFCQFCLKQPFFVPKYLRFPYSHYRLGGGGYL